MNIPFRPLGKVRDIVQSTGLDIAYAYDDLVFSDHSLFILRFDDHNNEILYLYFNADCIPQEAKSIEKQLIDAGILDHFKIINTGHFTLNQSEGKEEIEITFL